MKTGIIILNYNSWQETVVCVESIRKFTTSNYTIYIVDNQSTDNSYHKLQDKYNEAEDVYLVQSIINGGYSAGNNIGIKIAEKDSCEFIFIVNSDIQLLNDAFKMMTETLMNHPECMIVGPSVTSIEGNESQKAKAKLTPLMFVLGRHPFCKISFLSSSSKREFLLPQTGRYSFMGSVSGCCFGIRTADFAKIHYFDEHLFLYYEEDILAYKMEKLQKKSAVDMDAKVLHKESVTTSKEGIPFMQFHRWTSALYVLKNYAHAGKMFIFCIALWNTVTWALLSCGSDKYRGMLKKFWKRNWNIVFDKF